MTDNEIINELKEEIILLLNCTESAKIKEKLLFILNGNVIDMCKCPMCGETFNVDENEKHSFKIL
jgi:hypothetical protein